MSHRFQAIPNPDDALLKALCDSDPTNPFLAREFVVYRSAAGNGARPWMVGLEQNGQLRCGCIAYLQPSRLPWSRQLEIHSLLPVTGAVAEIFWSGLQAFCRQHRVSRLTLLTFGTRASVPLPEYPGLCWQRERCEYVLDLESFDGKQSLSSNHRRNVNRAVKAGVEIAEVQNARATEEHAELMGLSLQRRRSRGEAVGAGDAADPTRRLLASGAGRIYQAAVDGVALSSILVLRSREGVYYHSAGTSPEGMKAGASHLLLARLAQQFRDEGLRVFNLGGTDSEGLARFKAGFGAEPVALEAAAYAMGGPMSRLLDVMSAKLRRYRP